MDFRYGDRVKRKTHDSYWTGIIIGGGITLNGSLVYLLQSVEQQKGAPTMIFTGSKDQLELVEPAQSRPMLPLIPSKA